MRSNFIRFSVLSTVFLLLLYIPAGAQSKLNTSISGKVYDKSTNGPLEYATITLISKPTGKVITGTIADVKGAFSISNIPFDTYQVNIEFIGYEKTTLDDINSVKQ